MMTLSQFLDLILPNFFSQNPSIRSAERNRNHIILIKLMRKFGSPILDKSAPEAWRKQLNNARKTSAKAEKKREQKRKGMTTEDSGDAVESGSIGRSILTGASRPDSIADLLRDSDDESEEEAELEDLKSRRSSRKSRMELPVWLKVL